MRDGSPGCASRKESPSEPRKARERNQQSVRRTVEERWRSLAESAVRQRSQFAQEGTLTVSKNVDFAKRIGCGGEQLEAEDEREVLKSSSGVMQGETRSLAIGRRQSIHRRLSSNHPEAPKLTSADLRCFADEEGKGGRKIKVSGERACEGTNLVLEKRRP